MPDPRIADAMRRLTQARTDLMVDEATVTRPGVVGPTPPLDPDTLQPVTPPGATVYTAMPCVVSDPTSGSSLSSARIVSEESAVPNQRLLKTPHAYTLQPGDVVTVTVSSFSPGLVGDRFTVIGEDERSFATYRRYVLRGSSWLSS